MRKPVSWEKKRQRYIIAALRRIWRWSPERRQCLAEASNGKTGKLLKFKCESCAKWAGKRDRAVDHVLPVVEPGHPITSIDEYCLRLFCGRGNLQVLCSVCHKAKSKKENAERRRLKHEND